MEKFNGNLDKGKLKKFEINVQSFFDDEEYRTLVMRGCFYKMLDDMDAEKGFNLENPNPLRLLEPKDESRIENMYQLGFIDGMMTGVDIAKKRVVEGKLIHLHKKALTGQKNFANLLTELIDDSSKNGAMFMDGEMLRKFVDVLKFHGETAENELEKLSEITE